MPIPPPPAPTGHGPAGRFLADPDRWLADLAHRLIDPIVELAARYGPAIVLAAVVVVAGWWLLRAHRARRLRRHARQITILAPPQVEPGSVEALWTALHA